MVPDLKKLPFKPQNRNIRKAVPIVMGLRVRDVAFKAEPTNFLGKAQR